MTISMEKEKIRAKLGCCGDYNNCQHSCTSKGAHLEAERQRKKRHKHYDNRLAAWEEVIPALRDDAAFCFAIGFDLGAASVTQSVLTVTPSQIAHADSYVEDKVADPEPQTFHTWWNSGDLTKNNRYRKDSAAYWAWEGWHAAKPEDQV